MNKKIWVIIGIIIVTLVLINQNQEKKEYKKIGTISASLLMDTRVQEGNPAVIDGTSEVLGVIESGGPYDEHTYLKFSMTGITETVTSATLTLSAWGGEINTVRVHQLYNSYAWSETTTNWNNRAVSGTNYGSIVDSILVDTTLGNVISTFDVTSIVNNCYVNGYSVCSFILTGTDDTWVGFNSKEDVSGVPSLDIITSSCQCTSGECCDSCNYLPDGSQPIGYTDFYYCSTPTEKKFKDWVCNGISNTKSFFISLIEDCALTGKTCSEVGGIAECVATCPSNVCADNSITFDEYILVGNKWLSG